MNMYVSKLLTFTLLTILLTSTICPAYAYRKGYYRKDGTWVSPSYGTSPRANFAVKMNTNSYDWKRMNTQRNSYTNYYKPPKVYKPKPYKFKY